MVAKRRDRHVSVLPIVGMGGIGKTTLAQMVCNDPLVHKRFPFQGWVCVSEDSDIESLKHKITLSFSNATKKSIEGGEQFLVLDDIWYQNRELWDSLKAFIVGAGTRKVLVTTRNDHVASIMQTTSPIYLGNLSFNNCWLLFKKIAFEQRDHSGKVAFRDIGMKIVEKCGGLPLAVKMLACALSYEEDVDEWIDTLDSGLWEFDDEKSNILPALKLSYDRMPIELRQCFMYLSLFPKDSHLERSVIVKQWMSQGFLHAEDEKIEEDIGNAYYDELLQRSIIQCYVGKLKEIFIMHDLIHDLAQLVARDGYLLITSDELQSIPKSIRHVSLYLNRDAKVTNVKHLLESQLPRERLRTLILPYVKGFPIANLLHNFTCLRTLVLKEYEDLMGNKEPLELFDSIGNLKHIRYLDLHIHKFHPASLYKLYHLQTFKGSLRDKKTPGGIGDLINLRHLDWYDIDCLPREIGWLTNLQSLLTFTVGEDSWRCKVRDLKNLNHIRGRFHVRGLETVKWLNVTPPEHLLMTKPGIENLYLWWGDDSVQHKVDDELAKQVLECLRPHPNVVELSIKVYPGSIFPLWLGDASFSKLQDLQLSGGNCMSLPTLGQLPSLKSLCIMRMERVKSVGRELLLSDPLNPIASAVNATQGMEWKAVLAASHRWTS